MSGPVCSVCGAPGYRNSTKCEPHYCEVFARLRAPRSGKVNVVPAKNAADARKLAAVVWEHGQIDANRLGLNANELPHAVAYAVEKAWVVEDGDTLRVGSASPALPAEIRALVLARALHSADGPMGVPDAVEAAGFKKDASNREKVIRYAIDRGWVERPKRGVLIAGSVVPPASLGS